MIDDEQRVTSDERRMSFLDILLQFCDTGFVDSESNYDIRFCHSEAKPKNLANEKEILHYAALRSE